MSVNEQQARALAFLATSCRPHGASRWDEAGVLAAIAKVKHLALADVMLAVARAADDRELKTPGAIGNTTAPCWRERDSNRPAPREPFDPDLFCGICNRPGDGRHPDDHDFESTTRDRIAATKVDGDRLASRLQAMRESIGDAKAEREPEPSPEPLPSNPRVGELRAAIRDEQPAPHLSPDRRRPLCGEHVPEHEHESELESA